MNINANANESNKDFAEALLELKKGKKNKGVEINQPPVGMGIRQTYFTAP
jgi:hypothetical protein